MEYQTFDHRGTLKSTFKRISPILTSSPLFIFSPPSRPVSYKVNGQEGTESDHEHSKHVYEIPEADHTYSPVILDPYYSNIPMSGSLPSAETKENRESHYYETPNDIQAQVHLGHGTETHSGGGVVEFNPAPKQVQLPDGKSDKDDFPLRIKGSKGNYYSSPPRDSAIVGEESRYQRPEIGDDCHILKPPRKYDNLQLQFMRAKTASTTLPNVPHKMNITPHDENA